MALDPILQQMLNQMPIPASEKLDIAAYRAAAEAFRPMMVGPEGPIAVASIEDRTLSGPRGDIAIRIYRPSGAVEGTLHHYYGGGWSVGNIDIIDPIARRLARDLSMVVVTSNYRLAPENPFPAGLDDCLVAARWTLDHAGELGGGDQPVVVSGESAGANLAAVVGLVLRDERPGRSFDAQLLVHPAVDLRDTSFQRASVLADADPSLRSHSLRQLYPLYSAGHDHADPRLSPLAADDLSGLPPAVIAVLTVDPLRDEAVEYADRLRAADVPVELIEFGNLTHGFTGLTVVVPAADRAFTRTLAGLRHMLARKSATTARS
ncbi:alpha/beta hydrolase [Sphingobium sp. 3R8]|uniref:alpha/beta hydrolase n=1 Tax=Sphingobium sp. 3R8 TaxID=2874921 RepID=UPI001CCA3ABA|nr:alpha/beta hydrolase [Sphingobium sp. 3R8]MBZ9646302.1 alpha/beta hydrolase [Sphingobium sp. 3R8]